jgi:hypothetical protein
MLYRRWWSRIDSLVKACSWSQTQILTPVIGQYKIAPMGRKKVGEVRFLVLGTWRGGATPGLHSNCLSESTLVVVVMISTLLFLHTFTYVCTMLCALPFRMTMYSGWAIPNLFIPLCWVEHCRLQAHTGSPYGPARPGGRAGSGWNFSEGHGPGRAGLIFFWILRAGRPWAPKKRKMPNISSYFWENAYRYRWD